jgi:uncharacterized LabA/DUF88 family protein
MHFRKNERLAVFIDGANLSAAVSALDLDIDFQQITRFFREECNLVRIYFYAVLPNEKASIRQLLDWLEYHHYSVTAKSFSKGGFAVDLAVEALRIAPRVDHVVLMASDNRYRALVAGLQHMGRRVSVISTKMPHPVMVDEDLRRQADHFIDLSDLKPYFERRKKAALAHA